MHVFWCFVDEISVLYFIFGRRSSSGRIRLVLELGGTRYFRLYRSTTISQPPPNKSSVTTSVVVSCLLLRVAIYHIVSISLQSMLCAICFHYFFCRLFWLCFHLSLSRTNTRYL